MTKVIPESELVLNKDGSVYHLNLLPEDIAETIITVGDPDRVGEVSKYFDKIEVRKQHREFVTHTGYLGNKRLTVVSTGIGPDNIDIVFNELDALVNIDLKTREIKPQHTSLRIIRVGTSGGLQEFLGVDSFVVSDAAFGMDGVLHYYQNDWVNKPVLDSFIKHIQSPVLPYYAEGNDSLTQLFSESFHQGITVTCNGFYGPQGRILRLQPAIDGFIAKLHSFDFEGRKILNFEMETSAIYGLGHLLGHRCCSLSVIVANRVLQKFSKDGATAVDKLIKKTLETLCQ